LFVSFPEVKIEREGGADKKKQEKRIYAYGRRRKKSAIREKQKTEKRRER